MLLTEDEIKKVKVSVTYLDDALARSGYVTVSLNDKEYFKENIYKREKSKVILTKIFDFFHIF